MEKYTYACDGGSLAIGNEEVVCQFINHYGDGMHDVYIVDRLTEQDHANSTFEGAVHGKTIKIYDYDCLTDTERADDSHVLVTLSGRYGVFAMLHSGTMILEKWD